MVSLPKLLFCASLLIVSSISQVRCQKEKKGIMCYVCNSARDPGCEDPFNPSTAIKKLDCEQFMPNMSTSICRKTVQKVILDSKMDYRVIRTCGYIPEHPRGDWGGERCYSKAGTSDVQVTFCACHADGCNHSSRQAFSSLSLVSHTTLLQLATLIAGSYHQLNRSFY